jgi:hypothetical protein
VAGLVSNDRLDSKGGLDSRCRADSKGRLGSKHQVEKPILESGSHVVHSPLFHVTDRMPNRLDDGNRRKVSVALSEQYAL